VWAVGHPEGTRSALDRFSETSIVDQGVRGDVPPHPLPSGERLLLALPRLRSARLVVLVLVAAGCSRARQLARSLRRGPRAGLFGGADLAAGRRAGAPPRKRRRRSPSRPGD
jgi:hypothetical protein